MILELLALNPNSPKLYCLLGDVKSDPSLYHKAWEVSNGKFARAMRSLGADYFRKSDWKTSIDCYARALAINPLFENSWFIMGCAALKIEEFDIAIKSFSRVAAIDPDNGEAWNNLASVYIKQKKLPEAFRCLKEAIRPNFDASNIWENYLFVSVDLGEFQESIRAMERIFTVRIEKPEQIEHAIDYEILNIVVKAIMDDVVDINETHSSALVPRMKQLLDLITSRINSTRIYTICAKFYQSQNENRKSLDFAQKAYRGILNDPLVNEKELHFKQLVHVTLGLVEAYSILGSLTEEVRVGGSFEVVCKDWNYQAKMALKAVMGRTKVYFIFMLGYIRRS